MFNYISTSNTDDDDIDITSINKEYDLLAREVLSTKQILAYLLKYLIDDYKDLSIEEIYQLIEDGDDSSGKYIKGINTSDTSDNKEIRHDIVFTPKLPNGKDRIGMYVGVESQKDDGKSIEKIYKRSLYYQSRLISRQAKEAFKNSDYKDLKKTNSIWLIFNPLIKYRNSIMKFSLTPDFDINEYPLDFETNYFNIYIVNMGKGYDYTKKGLFEMLSLVFDSYCSHPLQWWVTSYRVL